MTRRSAALAVATTCLVLTFGTLMFLRSPYVIYSPGPTVNLLGKDKAGPYVRVNGTKAYRDDGALRLLTVIPSGPDSSVSFGEALIAWVRPSQAVYRYSDIYRPDETDDQLREESQLEMVTSQDSAKLAAYTMLGTTVPSHVEVLSIERGGPGDGALEVHDQILAVNGTPITSQKQAVERIQGVTPGQYVKLALRRADKRIKVRVKTAESSVTKGKAALKVTIGTGYDFPADINVKIDENIGGPSAGLMMAMAIYDVLTPGSMTEGQDVAGTGTIAANGDIGPIGGIQQKIAGAEAAGAHLFLAPAWHCDQVKDASWDHDKMRVVKVSTLKDAVTAVETWSKHPDATLPSC